MMPTAKGFSPVSTPATAAWNIASQVRLHAERSAQSEVVVQLESLLGGQGFLKRMLASKSAAVRAAAYTLVAHLCYR